MALTANFVKTTWRPGYYHDGKGLYLRVIPSGGKSWAYRYRINGALREMGLGAADLFDDLEEVRQAHSDARRMLKRDRRDPIEARRAERAASLVDRAKSVTFRDCAEQYIESHRAGWHNAKHAAQWPQTLVAYVFPVFGNLPIVAVDVGLVMRVIEPLWTVRPETASRVRGRIESVLDWATARGYRTGDNPARWKGLIENLLPQTEKVRAVEHLAAVPYAELPGFMARLREVEGEVARALEWTILTAARTGTVIGMRWEEIDLAASVWVVPASRMKAGREHKVPLSEAALQILPAQIAGRIWGIGPNGMLGLMRSLAPGKTVHGFRSTFSDWCAEQTNFPSEVREMALAHAVGSKVEAAYRRGDLFQKRRELAEAWARYCAGVGEAEVIPLRGRG